MQIISIIIPWSNREEIRESLLKNTFLFNQPHIELIIANCGGSFDWLYNSCFELFPSKTKILDIHDAPFNKGLALNLGVSVSNGSVLFFLDADVIVEEDIFQIVLGYMSEPYFITIERIFESDPSLIQRKEQWIEEVSHKSEFVFADKTTVIAETNRIRFSDGSRSAPGLIFVRRDDFLAIKGMNSKLQWWGWEDIDLQVRLQSKGKITKLSLGKAIHLSHDDEVRNLLNGSRMDSESTNFSICYSEYNSGNFYGTYYEDINKLKSSMQLHEIKKGR